MVNTGAGLGRIPTRLLAVIVPVVAVVAVVVTNFVSEDQQGTQSGSAAAPDTVVIKNFSFSPKPITVKIGSTITVINDDNTTHTLTADDGAFNTGDLGGGQRGSVTVDRAGTYRYHCTIHTFMTGTARVTP
jgi:plastocyanin